MGCAKVAGGEGGGRKILCCCCGGTDVGRAGAGGGEGGGSVYGNAGDGDRLVCVLAWGTSFRTVG